MFEDAGLSGKSLDRPALTEALDALDAGEASALVVAKLDRLSRSLLDFATVMARAERHAWNFIALDLGIDTTTPSGEFTATVVAGAARYEGRLISARTKDALAARKAAGVRLGRPTLLADDTAERIRAERADGATLQAIADQLNTDRIATPKGKRWSPALVRKVAIRLD
jgi:DNA invertase Pin-like site-specific DNA recombinase